MLRQPPRGRGRRRRRRGACMYAACRCRRSIVAAARAMSGTGSLVAEGPTACRGGGADRVAVVGGWPWERPHSDPSFQVTRGGEVEETKQSRGRPPICREGGPAIHQTTFCESSTQGPVVSEVSAPPGQCHQVLAWSCLFNRFMGGSQGFSSGGEMQLNLSGREAGGIGRCPSPPLLCLQPPWSRITAG